MLEITGNKFIVKKEYSENNTLYMSVNDIVVLNDVNFEDLSSKYNAEVFNVSKGIDFVLDCKVGERLNDYLEPLYSTVSDNNYNPSKFEQVLEEMKATYIRKNSDYGNSFDQSLDKFGLIASVVRLGDKMNRIESLVKNPNKQQVLDESIRDTFMDMANYSAMTVAWMDKQK